jgi:predicted dehydrogenase
MNTKVGIGLIGAGWAAAIHARGYQRTADLGARVVAVAARHSENARTFAQRYDIPAAYDDPLSVIRSPDVDVVDLVLPNVYHHSMAIAAAQAGKHVVCEKPLTGYFGDGKTPRQEMLDQALRNADAIVEAAEAHGVRVMYAENLVYAPAVHTVVRMLPMPSHGLKAGAEACYG